jgi:adenylate cyclase
MTEFLETYAQGRTAYMNRDFQQALELFQKAQGLQEQDRAVSLHIQRSLNYIQLPPPDSWDGVHTMTTK